MAMKEVQLKEKKMVEMRVVMKVVIKAVMKAEMMVV